MATVTLHLDEETLERAKHEASRRGTSVEKVAEERVRELAGYAESGQLEAMRRLFHYADEHPIHLREGIPSRDERQRY